VISSTITSIEAAAGFEARCDPPMPGERIRVEAGIARLLAGGQVEPGRDDARRVAAHPALPLGDLG